MSSPESTQTNEPRLWVVATPLGNAGDLSPRAAEILSRVHTILAEDTRRAGQLFKRLELERSGSLLSFFEHNEEQRLPQVLRLLEEGHELALISDAGTPLLSDPGFRLVRACREQGITVSPVPGPSAPLAALSACGLPPLPFSFLGFPPRGEARMRRFFAVHRDTGATLVFFERKSRLQASLQAAFDALGDREFCIARELTKDFEEFIPGRLGSIAALDTDLRGEITVVIGPSHEDGPLDEAAVLALVEEERAGGGKPKDIARRVADKAEGWTAKAIYALMR